MLITLQQPLVDYRSFISGDTGRLTRPSWPVPLAGIEFIRGFGPIASRRPGGNAGGVGEHVFCEVRSRQKEFRAIGHGDQIQSSFCRLFFYGTAVGRFEQGWYLREFGKLKIRQILNGAIRKTASAPSLAQQYHFATTRNGMANEPLGQYRIKGLPVVKTGPLLFICQSKQPINNIAEDTIGQIARPRTCFYRDASADVAAWLTHQRDVPVVIIHAPDWTVGRDLRISLARWHAEAQALGFIFHFVQGALCPAPRSAASDALQAQIMRSLRVVVGGKEVHLLAPASAIRLPAPGAESVQPIASELLSLIGPGITEALIQGAHKALERLDARPNVRRRLVEVQPLFPPPEERPLWFCNVVDSDRPLFEEFHLWMTNPRRRKVLQLWDKRKVPPGEDVAGTVKSQLERAAVVLLFMSPRALVDESWCDVADIAISRHKAGKSVVVPVLLRHADVSVEDFIDAKSLPSNGKPVYSWRNRNEAWRDVCGGLKDLLPANSSCLFSEPWQLRGSYDSG